MNMNNENESNNETILLHLKELCSEFSDFIVSMFKNKLSKLLGILNIYIFDDFMYCLFNSYIEGSQ